MEKRINSPPLRLSSPAVSSATAVSDEVSSQSVDIISSFFSSVGVGKKIPPKYDIKDYYSDLIRGLLKVDRLERGRVSCFFSVKPVFTNAYGGLHGGAVAALAERVSIGCARTVVGEDKELFLGEMNISYLSAAQTNAKMTVDASVVKTGRVLTVIAAQFRLKESGKLAYISHVIFYNMPAASL